MCRDHERGAEWARKETTNFMHSGVTHRIRVPAGAQMLQYVECFYKGPNGGGVKFHLKSQAWDGHTHLLLCRHVSLSGEVRDAPRTIYDVGVALSPGDHFILSTRRRKVPVMPKVGPHVIHYRLTWQ